MPDEIKLPVQEEKEDTIGAEVHNKSFREIVAEANKELREENREEITPEVKPDVVEEKPNLPIEELSKPQDDQSKRFEEETKRANDLATKAAQQAAEEVIKKQKEEDARIAAVRKADEDDEKKKEELIPAWTKENRLPKDYDEITSETMRIAKEEMRMEIAEKEAAKEAQQAEQKQAQYLQQEARKKQIESANQSLNKQLDDDLTDLYANNKLPKIKDENDPNDPGLKARNALFQAGVKINQERMAKGQTPIASIKLIYYEHYKPPVEPAGADAPVVGNTQPSVPTEEDGYNYARDHKKSMREMLAEAKAEARKKLQR